MVNLLGYYIQLVFSDPAQTPLFYILDRDLEQDFSDVANDAQLVNIDEAKATVKQIKRYLKAVPTHRPSMLRWMSKLPEGVDVEINIRPVFLGEVVIL